jgi:pimeloyl-ACP methyl ester carboxylesterase
MSRPDPVRSGPIDAPFVRLWVTDEGPLDAPTVLLVGRMGAQAFEWSPTLVAVLRDQGLRVVRFDPRGFGWSGLGPAGPYHCDDFVRDALAVVDTLGLASVHLMATSFGGVIAREMALERPALARTLTLVASSPGDGSIPVWSSEYRELATRPPGPRFDERVDYLVRELDLMSAHRMDPDFAHARAVRAVSRGWSVASLRRTVRAANARDQDERQLSRLRGLTMPCLVIHGGRDLVLSIEHGRALAAALPGSRLIELEDMGHEPVPADVAHFAPDLIAHLRLEPTSG